MTQIGVGIGGNKSPTKKNSLERQNHSTKKVDSTTGDDYDDEDAQNVLGRNAINTQNSSNSSEQRRCGGGDDDNSNSFESHSDFDLSHTNEKSTHSSKHSSREKTSRQKNRRGMSVNWGSSGSHGSSTLTNVNRPNRGHNTQKHGSNVKFFATSMAHSLYRNPIRLSGLSPAGKSKGNHTSSNKNALQTSTVQSQPNSALATISSEPELQINRVNPPQPRPESLAIMSEELFHERLKARQSPLLSNVPPKTSTSLSVNTQLTNNFPSTSSFLLDNHCIEDVTYSTSNQTTSDNFEKKTSKQITPPPSPVEVQQRDKLNSDTESNLIQLAKDATEQEQQLLLQEHQKSILSPIKTMVNCSVDSSDESWRLLNSNSSLDEHIPYIDETDFEDLGKNFVTNNFLN